MLGGKYANLVKGAVALFVIFTVGTLGYYIIGEGKYSLVDCFYMTAITISTVGFEEIVELEGKPWGRVFTVFVAFAGIGIVSYIFLNIASLFIEGEITEILRGRRMQKRIKEIEGHYIVCGVGWLGFYVARELDELGLSYVIVDIDRSKIESFLEHYPDALWVEGDATEEVTLEKAGIHRAKGVFVTTRDDSKNLMIALTAKLMNPSVRVVVHCANVENEGKFKKIGVDGIVTSQFIGGVRMVSEMVKPSVASFLDVVLRGELEGLRIDEVEIPREYRGKKLSEFCEDARFGEEKAIVVALQKGGRWIYDPDPSVELEGGEKLIFIATEGAVKDIQKFASRTGKG